MSEETPMQHWDSFLQENKTKLYGLFWNFDYVKRFENLKLDNLNVLSID